MSLHGLSRDAWERYTAAGTWYYEVKAPGYKYNVPDILAALGLQQLWKYDRFFQVRQRYAALYTRAFAETNGVLPSSAGVGVQHAWHLYVLRLQLEALRIDRARFIDELHDRNIGASVHFIPLHLHPYYQKAFGYRRGDFPHAEWNYDRCVSLPLYPGMSEQDVWLVVEAVRDILRRHRR